MKLLPGLFNDHFDDFFNFNDSFFTRNSNVMKTDIHEVDGNYLLDMELPGYSKEDVQLELKDGYLRVYANHNTSNEEKDEKGNIIRQERYSGFCERSFFVGDDVKEDEIKANFANGELKITFPKQHMKQVEEKRYIPID